MRHLTILFTALLLALGLIVPPAMAADVISDTIDIRLAQGDNSPAATALRFSQATFPDDGTVDEVLLATDAAFADALASGTLQGEERPLLLTSTSDVRSDVAGEIDRLGAQRVTILGGENALDADVEEELTDAGLTVDRIAGDTRLTTAAAIAETLPSATTALLARAFGNGGDETGAFADALAAGAWAAEEGWPTLLTETDVLSDATRDALQTSSIERVIILGGEVAVGAAVEEELETMGLEVDRVSGLTRFDTAIAIAEERGFDSQADAERIILAEGQAGDAWAAGFAAAAHGAIVPAPIVLANGDALPQATVEFLVSTAGSPGTTSSFAVDAADVTDPVLVCAAAAAACDSARLLLGLPQKAELSLAGADLPIPSRTTLEGTIDLFDHPASVAVFGPCITEGLVVPDEDGAFTLRVQADPGDCALTFEITFDNGSVQLIERELVIDPAEPQQGTVIDTETGGDTYTFVPLGADAPLDVMYRAADLYVVDGEPATIGAFEAAITVADQVTFSADTDEGTVHDLVNVDPASISEGTVGNVDLAAATFAIIEPVSGVVLRDGLVLTDELTYTVGSTSGPRETFEAAINEGDRIVVGTSSLRLTDLNVLGTARDITVDAVSGIARLRIGGLGDDPLNAENDRFRARADEAAQTFRVDGGSSSFAAFAAALSDGDQVRYRRTAGVESFELTNAPQPAVTGLVTETFDPDGSAVAPEPSDGGDIVLLTSAGRQLITYSADSVFRIDGNVATEQEFELARTAGDEVTYQVSDPATDTAEEVQVLNRDLAGELTDITEGANTYDVVVLGGVVYDDLNYTEGVFGGSDSYLINGDTVGLAQFENELALVDRGEVIGSVVVRPGSGGTEHRLTAEDNVP